MVSDQPAPGASGEGIARLLCFRVEGLAGLDEVRVLRAAVGPLVGGEEKLSFDTKAGLMAVFAGTGVTEAMAAVMAGIGMRAERLLDEFAIRTEAGFAASAGPLVFAVLGLVSENEVRVLRQMVGPLVGGGDRVFFDIAKGIMTIAPAYAVPTSAVVEAVARIGMRAMARVGTPGSPALLLRVRGLGGKNEVALLERVIGSLAGGTHALAFDIGRGAMTVAPRPGRALPVQAIQEAVALTGMHAEPWSAAVEPAVPDARGMAWRGNVAVATAPPQPTHVSDAAVFKVHGLGCGSTNARTGMCTELWQEGEQTAASAAEDRRRRVQTWLTAASVIFIVVAVALHAWLGGGFVAALGAEEAAGGTPLPAILTYAIAIACAVRYAAPEAWLSVRHLQPDMNLLAVVTVAGAVGIGEWLGAATIAFIFALASSHSNRGVVTGSGGPWPA
ncbi:hypothetical protein [Roseomonas mucosa]